MDKKLFKEQLLRELYEPYRKCMKCPLATQGRTTVVFGEGNADADLMIIGEGPGRDEDAQGRPFVGRSGQLLTRTLQALGQSRENVFITNIVKCRPPENRVPTDQESATCKQLLLAKQIKIVQPALICTLGSTALRHLINEEVKITSMRGKIIDKDDLRLFPTYHPAFILRNPGQLPIFTDDLRHAIELAKKLKAK
jgi:DNA polymerase